jgi:hypothetical protein
VAGVPEFAFAASEMGLYVNSKGFRGIFPVPVGCAAADVGMPPAEAADDATSSEKNWGRPEQPLAEQRLEAAIGIAFQITAIVNQKQGVAPYSIHCAVYNSEHCLAGDGCVESVSAGAQDLLGCLRGLWLHGRDRVVHATDYGSGSLSYTLRLCTEQYADQADNKHPKRQFDFRSQSHFEAPG